MKHKKKTNKNQIDNIKMYASDLSVSVLNRNTYSTKFSKLFIISSTNKKIAISCFESLGRKKNQVKN